MSTLTAPLGNPPPGGDRNRGPQLLGPAVTFTVLAIIFVTARLVSRTFVTRNLGLDDLFIVAASVSENTPRVHLPPFGSLTRCHRSLLSSRKYSQI